MSDELWTDDEIVDILKRRQSHLTLPNGHHVVTLMAAAELMRMVRDDYAARIAELEAERDAALVASATADANLIAELQQKCDDLSATLQAYDDAARAVENAPANHSEIAQTIRDALGEERSRLERGVEGWRETSSPYKRYMADIAQIDAALAWLDQQGTAPQPDWSDAPPDAVFWAVDADCRAWWFKLPPSCEHGEGAFWVGGWKDGDYDDPVSAGQIDLPLGIDWRATLCRRPQT